jgi:hypothetical protein
MCRRHKDYEPAKFIEIKDLLCVRVRSSHENTDVSKLHLSTDNLLEKSEVNMQTSD